MGFRLSKDALRRYAYEALEGVGDPAVGQWEEWTGYAFHVRRRVTAEEEFQIGPVVDIRNTVEALRRVQKVRMYLPDDWKME